MPAPDTGSQALPPLWRPNLAGFRYTQALMMAWHHRAWVYDSADWAALTDQQAWEKIRRDADWGASIERRRRMTSGLSWQCQGRSEGIEDVITASVIGDLVRDHLQYFWRARYHQTEAVFRGSAHQIIRWGKVRWRPPIKGAPELEWWAPMVAYPVDRWRLRIVREPDDPQEAAAGDIRRIRARWQLYSIARAQWEPLACPHAWVSSHYSLEEDTLGYGRGLNSFLIWYFRAKEICLTNGIEGVERWAQGIVTAKIGGYDFGAVGTERETVQESWKQELERMRTRNVLVYGQEDEVDVIWPSGAGWQLAESVMRYLNEGGIRLIEGSTMASSQGSRGGSAGQAQSTTHASETDDYFAPDREQQSEDWTRSVIALAWRLNQTPLRIMLGLHGYTDMGARPHLTMGDEETEDPQQVAMVAAQLIGAGIPLLKQEVYERAGYTQPGPNDAVFEQPAAQQPAGGGLAELMG